VKNRRIEPWALEGLRYLNHPLRARQSLKYLRPALELLPEIRRTGDIFFPKNWMDAALSGHNTEAAAQTIRTFLEESPNLPARLRQIVLQSADDLFRAAD
jgi:aminopeptidase N